MAIFPEIPADARQTNCWKFILILESVAFVLNLISYCSVGYYEGLPGLIINIVIFYICMYHVAYVRVDVSEQVVEVSMGPWQWCFLRWIFSSQVSKEEIVSIERKQRQCLYDIFPRFYCLPVNWCCCHKSYSAYYWPCCCNDVNCCNLCDGDSDTSDMIQINLTASPTEFNTMCCKRCAPFPIPFSFCVCCVYNRIAVSVPNSEVIEALQNLNYPLQVGMAENERTALVTEGAAVAPTEGGETVTPV